MHIPDGFLSTPVWTSTWLLSAGGLSYCIKKTKESLKGKMVPLMGVMSAFIFAAQMINFPVAGGTSGHLLGGVLAAVLLGPYAGAVVITCVLVVQSLLFQDGGITTLGANIFNMSLVGTMGGYFVYYLITKIIKKQKGMILGAAISAWLSVIFASVACAFELAFSGTVELNVVLPAMAGIHALIGLGEAVITCLVIGFVLKVRPDILT